MSSEPLCLPRGVTGKIPPAVYRILERLKEAGHEAYLVGGCVRDLIRGVTPEDYDIVTSAVPEEIEKLFPRTIPVGVKFGVLLVIEECRKYEVATFRSDEGYRDGRHPEQVRFADAKADVLRRDFTINGLLLDPGAARVLDFVGGCRDIGQRLVRTIGPARIRMAEDHLRMLRAIRFAANLRYNLDPEILEAVRDHAGHIHRISAERIREELTKMLTRGGARRGMEFLSESGLLKEILPEVEALKGVDQPPEFHPEGDVWEHTLRMLDLLPQDRQTDARLAWGVIMHDIGKAVTRTVDEQGVHFYGHTEQGEEIARRIMERLRFSTCDRETVQALVRHHMRFMNVKKMRPNRLKRFLRMPDFDLHLELHRLDCLGSHGMLDYHEFCRARLEEIPAEELRPPRLLTGRDLIEMGFTPGPLFGRILQVVEDAQLNGEISSSSEARRLVSRRWKPAPP